MRVYVLDLSRCLFIHSLVDVCIHLLNITLIMSLFTWIACVSLSNLLLFWSKNFLVGMYERHELRN